MTGTALTTVDYEGQAGRVIWRGVSMRDDDGFNTFMSNDVSSRLHDEEGDAKFEAILRGVPSTKFGHESLDAILNAKVSEERDWAVGEAMAEAYLSREYAVIWPWNMERDKRNPNASLSGADLIGFINDGGVERLVLGEVKSSSENRYPPQVMSGKSGMTNQIDVLANDLSRIRQILRWLLPRCKNTQYEASFNAAVGLFFDSGNRAIALFGVLTRDTQPNELDLQARGQTLARILQAPTTCRLIAMYLPCTIADLPSRVSGGGS